MRKISLLLLSIACHSYSENSQDDWNIKVNCGIGFMPGLMADVKQSSSKSSSQIDDKKYTNPTYMYLYQSHGLNNNECMVAGSGEIDDFTWSVKMNDCTKVVYSDLSTKAFNICGISIRPSKINID